MQAAIKFCGCCNPRVDVESAGWIISGWLQTEGYIVSPDSAEAGLLVMVAGCETACVERLKQRETGQTVIVVVGTAPRWSLGAEPLAQRLRLALNA